ncbi:beta strand repeat-containing protein [Candidatus Omnitrophota bacterium]
MSGAFTGQATQSTDLSVSGLFNVDKGQWHIGTQELYVRDLIVADGALIDLGAGAELTITQSVDMSSGATVGADNRKSFFYANDADNTVSGGTFIGDVTITTDTATTWTLEGNLTIQGNLTIKNGATLDLDTYSLTVSDLVVIEGTLDASSSSEVWFGDDVNTLNGTYTAGSETVFFYSPNLATIRMNDTFYDLTVQKPGGTADVLAHFEMTNDVTINLGTLDMRSYDLTVGGNLDMNATLDASSGGCDIFVAGNWDSTGGTFSYTNGVVYFYGAADSYVTMGGEQVGDLHIRKDALSDNVTITDLLVVNDDLLVQSGTFFTNSELTLNANMTVSSGAAFTSLGQNETLFFNNANTVGYWINAGATVTLQGTSGSELKLRSNSLGNQWDFFQLGTKNISYVDVQDSDAGYSSAQILPTNSIDSGNTIYWFPVFLYIWDSEVGDFVASTRRNWDVKVTPDSIASCLINITGDAITWDIATIKEMTMSGNFVGSSTQSMDVTISDLLNIQVATWDMNTNDLSVSDLIIGNNGTLDTSSGDLTIGQSLSMTAVNTLNGTGTIFFYANDADNTISGNTFSQDVIITTDGATTWTLEANLTIVGDLTIKSGATLDLDTYDLSVSGIVTIEGGMDASSSSEVWFGDDVNSSSGTYTAGSETMFLYSANAATITIDEVVNAVTVQKGAGTATLANSLSAAGAMTVTSGTLDVDTYDLTVAGVVDVDGTIDASSAGEVWFGDDVDSSTGTYTLGTETMFLYSTNAATITIDEDIYDITIQKGGGNTATLANTLKATGAMTLTSGTLDIDTYDLTVAGIVDIDGTMDASSAGEVWFGDDVNTAGGTYTPGTETIFLYSANGATITIDETLYGVMVQKGAGIATLANTLHASASMTITSGTLDLDTYDLTVGGILDIDGTVDASSAGEVWCGDDVNSSTGTYTTGTETMFLYDTNVATITIDEDLYDVIVQKTGSSATLANDTNITNDLTLAVGNVDADTYDLTVGGNLDINTTLDGGDASCDLFVGGDFDATGGTFTYGSGTVWFYGTGDSTVTMADEQFNDVYVRKTAAGVTQNVTVSDLLKINGDLQVQDGIFFTNNELTLNANLTVSSGAGFTSLGANETIFFNDANTVGYWINSGATVTWQGTSGNELKLRSDSLGNQWHFVCEGTKNISYVDVQDSDASYSTDQILPTNSIDSGNNLYWFPVWLYIWDSEVGDFVASTRRNWNVKVAPDNNASCLINITNDPITWDINTIKEMTMSGNFGGSSTQSMNVTISDLLNIQVGTWNMNTNALSVTDLVVGNNGTMNTSTGDLTIGQSLSITEVSGINGTGTVFFYSNDADNTVSGGTITDDVIITTDGATTWTIENNLTIDGDLTIASGALFDMGAYELTVTGNIMIQGTLDASDASSALFIQGDWDSTGGTFTKGSGTVWFTGTSDSTVTVANEEFNNLYINKVALSDAVTISDTLSIGGDLLIYSGRFWPADDLTMMANMTVSSGAAFTCTTGNTWIFFNEDDAIGYWINAGASIELTSSFGNEIRLRSTSPFGAQWAFYFFGGRAMDYINVQDSDASGGPIVNPFNSIDSGNNINWFPTHFTWDSGGSDNNATTRQNWDWDNRPSNNHYVSIDDYADAITWDINTVRELTMNGNFSGTVTQSLDVTIGDLLNVQLTTWDMNTQTLSVSNLVVGNAATIDTSTNDLTIGQSLSMTKVTSISGTGTVFFYANDADNTVSGGTIIDDVVFTTDGTTTWTLEGNLTIDGDLTIQSGAVFDLATSSLTVTGSIWVAGEFDLGDDEIWIQNDFDATGGTVTYGTSTVYFYGSSDADVTMDDESFYNVVSTKTIYSYGVTETHIFTASTGDGYVGNIGAMPSLWADVQNATDGTVADDSSTTFMVAGVGKKDGGTTGFDIHRVFLPFDTSALLDGATVTSADLVLFCDSTVDDDNDTEGYLVVVGETTQASTSSLGTADFDTCGSVDGVTEGSAQVDITGISLGAELTFSLNATARSWIDDSGYTMLGLREGHDVDDLAVKTNANSTESGTFRSADHGTSANWPRLKVGYTGTRYAAAEVVLVDPMNVINDITVAGVINVNASDLTVGGDVVINNNMSLDGSDSASDIFVGGDWDSTGGNFDEGDGSVWFYGAADSYVTMGGEEFNAVYIDKDALSDNVTVSDRLSMSGDLLVQEGTFFTNSELTMNGNLTVSVGGSFTSLGAGETIFFNDDNSIGYFIEPSAEITLKGIGGDELYLRSNLTGSNWVFDCEGTKDIWYVNVQDSDATMSAELINPKVSTDNGNTFNWFPLYPIYIWDSGGADNNAVTDENWDNDSAPGGGTNVVIDDYADLITWDIGTTLAELSVNGNFTGSITQTQPLAVSQLFNLQVTSWDMNGKGLHVGNLVIGNNATLTTSTNDLTISQSLSMTEVNSIGGTGTVFFYANDNDNTISGSTITSDVIVTTLATNTWTLENDLTIVGDLTIKSGTVLDLDSYDLTVTGSIILEGTLDASSAGEVWIGDDFNATGGTLSAGSSTTYFYGTTDRTVTPDTSSFYNVTIQGGSVDIGANELTISGNLNLNTDTTLDGSDGSSNVFVGGNWDSTGATFIDGSGTVTFYGSTDSYVTITDAEFNALTINKTAASDNVSISNALSVASDLLVQGGTFFTNSELTLWGNLTVSSGAGFTSLGAGETIFFNEADTVGYWINSGATVFMRGNSVDLLNLRSTNSPNSWDFFQLGTKNISYISVKDSDATGSSTIISPLNSTDAGNTVWWFPPTHYIWDSGLASGTITFVGAGTAANVASGNVANVGIPAGIADGDVLIVVLHSRDNVDSTMAGDWTPIVSGNGTNNRLEMWWKRTSDAASETAPTITHTGGDSSIAMMFAFRDCIASGSPIDATGAVEAWNLSTISTTAITTNVDNSMILHAFGSQDDNTWGTYTGTPTNEGGQDNNILGNQNCMGLAYGLLANAGSTGAAGATQSAKDRGVSVQVALIRRTATDNNASTVLNWDNDIVAPSETHRVTIDTTSDHIDWDILANLQELTLNGSYSGETTQSTNLSVTGLMNLEVGTWHTDGYDLSIGNLIVSGTGGLDIDTSDLTITQSMDVPQNYQIGAGTGTVYFSANDADNTISGSMFAADVVFAGDGSGVWTVENDLTIDGDLTVQSGVTFDLGVYNLTVTGNIWVQGTLDGDSSTDIFVAGNWDSTGGTFKQGSSTIRFYGAADSYVTMGGEGFNEVYISKTALTDNVTISDGLSVAGDVLVESGTFFTSNELTLWGNLTVSSGADFTSVAPGETMFFNPADTVGYWINAGATVTWRGASGSNLLLRSTTFGQKWDFYQLGTRSIWYVDVQDSDASGSTEIIDPSFSKDSGNTNNWFIILHYVWDSGAGDYIASSDLNWDSDEKPISRASVSIDDTADQIDWDLLLNIDELSASGNFGGEITQSANLSVNGLFNVSKGSWHTDDFDLSVVNLVVANGAIMDSDAGDLTIGQSLSMTDLSTLMGTGTVFFQANDADNTISGGTITQDVIVKTDGSATWTLQNNLTIQGDLTIKSGVTFDLGSYSLSVSGALVIEGTLNGSSGELWISDTLNATGGTITEGTSTLYVYGTTSRTITSDTESFYNIVVQGGNASTVITLADDMTATNNITLNSGTFDPGANDLTIAGNVDLNSNATVDGSDSSCDVFVAGNWDSTGGTFAQGSGTIKFYGSADSTVTMGGEE